MENCLFTKLKGAATNPDLPVFRNIVRKTWLKTTVANQYVSLDSVAGQIRYQNLIIEIDFKLDSNTGNNAYLFDTPASYFREYYSEGNINITMASTTVTTSCSLNVNHTIKIDGVNKSYKFDDGAEQTITESTITTSKPAHFYLFSDRSLNNIQYGKVLIGRILFKDKNTVKAELVPALVDDVPCLYDLISGNTYTAADGNALEVL